MMKIEKSDKHTAYDDIKLLLNQARNNVVVQVNSILLKTYWQIGKIIVTDEQNNADRAEYGTNLLKNLSKQLTKEFGKGFSKSNLFNMRRFYLLYPKFQTLSGILNWSHYGELFSLQTTTKRDGSQI
ncbi:DUF1016 N-terminal domain-containing protein [Capnocytophaga stomatis]|uniref:DUF1016 N-terminal domain-containing protein n=1 Tax=Capnocytophaga stomatis TaxID=1848904 RepID=A0ABW8QD61_9FLAO